MSPPLFSVVTACYNRRNILERVLGAWERQTPGLPFELVAVDDGSSDGTRELLTRFRPRRYTLRVAFQENSGPAAARNRALELARGEYVFFTGDDIEPAPDLLLEHRRGHRAKNSPTAVVLGQTLWPPDASLTTTMRHIDGVGAQQFSFHFLRDGAEYDFRHFYTSNVSIARELLDREPDFFSTDFPAAAFEDAEFSYRLARHGARIFYRASARAYHHHRYTAGSFFRRQVRCGEMAALLYRRWPQLEKWVRLGELEALRIEALTEPSLYRRAARLAQGLELWENRALHLAEFFDPLLFEPVDLLLLDLFDYAYLAGLARASHPEDTAARLLAALYLKTLPNAVDRFVRAMDQEGHPYPRADVRAILGLRG